MKIRYHKHYKQRQQTKSILRNYWLAKRKSETIEQALWQFEDLDAPHRAKLYELFIETTMQALKTVSLHKLSTFGPLQFFSGFGNVAYAAGKCTLYIHPKDRTISVCHRFIEQ